MQEVLVATLACPVCGRMFEVPERVVSQGNLCRCSRCWTVLEILSVHPIGLREKVSGQPVETATMPHASPAGD